MSTSTSTALPFRRRFGYGVGDVGFNLFFATASLYLLYYYTEVLGLPPATAGWVFAVALIWDAIFDPLMGYIANRTRTRWGSYRPYLLFGAVPLAASWGLMFVPTGLTGTTLVIFAVAAHMLFRTLYAVVSMPYLALSAVITSDSHERGVLAAFRMMLVMSCGVFAAVGTLKFVSAFGGGQQGSLYTALLYGGLASALFIICFANTEEPAEIENAGPGPTIKQMLHMLRRNSAFWLVAGGMLAASVGSTMFQKTLPYYFKYVLGREDLIGTALGAIMGAAAFSLPVWTALMKRSSKRVVWLAGLSIALLAYALLWLVPHTPPIIIPLLALLGVAGSAGALCFWAMMPDTVEFGEWRTGIRAEGAIFGLVSLVQKGGLGLAAGLLGELLEKINYRANVVQSAETIAGMKAIMIGLPIGFSLLTIAFIVYYPIDPRTHSRLLSRLARRAARQRRNARPTKC